MKKQDSLVGALVFAVVSVGAAIWSVGSYLKDIKAAKEREAERVDAPEDEDDVTPTDFLEEDAAPVEDC